MGIDMACLTSPIKVLRQLHENEAASGKKLSFALPRALPSKRGHPHELLSSGAECCIFHLIPGTLVSFQFMGMNDGQEGPEM